MSEVRIWEEELVIPTYEVGEPDKNPMFLEKRVYQGSSGKVYPYPTTEKISHEKTDKVYHAVWLENEYLKVMILPELGGRIQRAYDKTNDYDFVYYNHVIKPALVGLAGPWISGGIEFNWPQHHRPTTYMPVDHLIQEHEDGSKTLLVNDVDQMYGTKGIAAFTLYPGKAYIEIRGQLYNRTAMPQTFLWWANPAVPVNDYTQSIFPPDVHSVYDHGKRDVSRFPIAKGVYYKHDYSEGVDISRYKNIPVPTSYMAETSEYDFVGGYDYQKEAGLLHVADHHFSPGKKQWTWGCGDFGKAWDRNLTDEDGPYIELMTGVYTENQPDFTWLKPFEEKTFKQYFMPYKKVGMVKNATIHAALGAEIEKDSIFVTVYATQRYENAEIVVTNAGNEIYRKEALISPIDIFEEKIEAAVAKKQDVRISVYAEGKLLVEYQPKEETIPELGKPAEAAKEPEEIMTNEELILTAQHIEQHRHATYLPDLTKLRRTDGHTDLHQRHVAGIFHYLRQILGAVSAPVIGNTFDVVISHMEGTAAVVSLASVQAADLQPRRHGKGLDRGTRLVGIADDKVPPQPVQRVQLVLAGHLLQLLFGVIFTQIPGIVQVKIGEGRHGKDLARIRIHHKNRAVLEAFSLTRHVPEPFVKFGQVLLHDRLQIGVDGGDDSVPVDRLLHRLLNVGVRVLVAVAPSVGSVQDVVVGRLQSGCAHISVHTEAQRITRQRIIGIGSDVILLQPDAPDIRILLRRLLVGLRRLVVDSFF